MSEFEFDTSSPVHERSQTQKPWLAILVGVGLTAVVLFLGFMWGKQHSPAKVQISPTSRQLYAPQPEIAKASETKPVAAPSGETEQERQRVIREQRLLMTREELKMLADAAEAADTKNIALMSDVNPNFLKDYWRHFSKDQWRQFLAWSEQSGAKDIIVALKVHPDSDLAQQLRLEFLCMTALEKINAIRISERIQTNGVASLRDEERKFVRGFPHLAEAALAARP